MNDAKKCLIDALKNNNPTEITYHFSAFCNALKNEVLIAHSKTAIVKLFLKYSLLEQSLPLFDLFMSNKVINQCSRTIIRKSINQLFHVLTHPQINHSLHKSAFILMLNLFSFLADTETPDDVLFFSHLITYGVYLFPLADQNSMMTKAFFPQINIKSDKSKTDDLTKKLLSRLFVHIQNDHLHSIFWWKILTTSVFPTILQLSESYFPITKPIAINYLDLLIFFFDTNQNMKIISYSPNILIRLITIIMSNENEEAGWKFSDKIAEKLTEIFLICFKTDPLSILIYFEAILPSLGNKFKYCPNAHQRWRFHHHMESWKIGVDNFPNISFINDHLSNWLITVFDPFSLYAGLIMIFYTKSVVPSILLKYFGTLEINDQRFEIVCSFASVISIVFVGQLLKITCEQLKTLKDDRIINDCGNYFVSIAKQNEFINDYTRNVLEYIGSVFVIGDSRSDEEVSNFFNVLFCGWESNLPIFLIHSCFVSTMVMVAQKIPSSISIPLCTFDHTLITYIGLSDGKTDHKISFLSFQIAIDIITLRGFPLELPDSLSLKISMTTVKSLSIADKSDKTLPLVAMLINSGNPMFMLIFPYFIRIVSKYFSQIRLDNHTGNHKYQNNIIISAIASGIIFFNIHQIQQFVEPFELRLSSIYGKLDFPEINNGNNLLDQSINILVSMNNLDPTNIEVLNALLMIHHYYIIHHLDPPSQFNDIDYSGVKSNFVKEFIAFPYIDKNLASIFTASFFASPNMNQDIGFLEVPFALCPEEKSEIWRQINDMMLINPSIHLIADKLINNDINNETNKPVIPTLEIDQLYPTSISSNNHLHLVNLEKDDYALISCNGDSHSMFSIKPFGGMQLLSQTKPRSSSYFCSLINSESSEEIIEQKTPQIFDELYQRITETGNRYLLATPEEFLSKKKDSNQYSSISSYSSSFQKRDSYTCEKTYNGVAIVAMAALNLFGDCFHETNNSKSQNLINKILTFNTGKRISIDVHYTKDSFPMNTNYSELFREFVNSLGKQIDSFSYLYRCFEGEIVYEIPAFKKKLYVGDHSNPVQIIWCENTSRTQSDCNFHDDKKEIMIFLRPLPSGLIKVTVAQSESIDKWYGPLRNEHLVDPQALPSLLHSTIYMILSIIKPECDDLNYLDKLYEQISNLM